MIDAAMAPAIRGLLRQLARANVAGLIAIVAELERRELARGKRTNGRLIGDLREAERCFVADPARARAILKRIRPALAAVSATWV